MIVDVQNKRELVTLGSEHSTIRSLAWSPNGKQIAVGLADGGVAIWNFDEVRRQLDELGLGWE